MSVKKLGVVTVEATLEITAGNITVADGSETAMKVTAEAGSCASSNAKRNKHIVSPDFLNAESYPTITFSAASDDQSPTPSSRTHRLDGEVTIKGQTSPLTFDVSELSIDGDAATFRSTATTDRFELGIDKLPSFVIARRLDIAVTATARRR